MKLAIFTLTLVLSALSSAASLPPLKAPCLSGRQAKLPQETMGRPCLLIFAFSRKGGEQAGAWQKALQQDWQGNSPCALYLVAELQGAPGFVLPFILAGMRRGTPKPLQDHFIVLRQDRELWLKELGFDKVAPDDAYLLLLDRHGEESWKAHGAPSPILSSALGKQLQKIANP